MLNNKKGVIWVLLYMVFTKNCFTFRHFPTWVKQIHPLKKSRGVTSASWPNMPIGWCVVGVLAQSGCRRFIQVDAAHWWWLRRFPPFHVKCFEYPEKHYINVTNYYYKMCFQQGFLNIYFRYLNFNLPQEGTFTGTVNVFTLMRNTRQKKEFTFRVFIWLASEDWLLSQ